MKEPKFRAYSPVLKAMIEEFDLMDIAYAYDCRYLIPTDDTITFDIFADDVIIMQSTGIEDKNGKEIYTADIVKSVFVRSDNTERVYTRAVIVDDEYAAFTLKGELTDWQLNGATYEIIGNIYENPELLN